MVSMETVRHISMDRLFQTVGGLLLTICLGLATWGLKTAVANSERITAIEANRFKADDGKDIWKEIAVIREAMAHLPKEVPPKWFQDLVKKLDIKVDKLDERLDSIERKLK